MSTPPPARATATTSRRPTAQPGFALIIVLTLMAFLVLLFVTLTVSIQVASQVTDYNLKATQARLNALYGVNVAMAQLQKFAGPDTRVTGTADFGNWTTGGSNNLATSANSTYIVQTLDTASGVGQSDTANAPNAIGGTRFWTGVWGNGAPSYSFYQGNSTALSSPGNATLSQPTPVLLNWLVSGNENTPLKLAIALNGNSTATNQAYIGTATAATPNYTPTIAIQGASNATFNANVTAASALTISGASPSASPNNSTLNGVLLVGPNTVGNSSLTTSVNGVPITQSAASRYIVAPLVSISIPGDSGIGSSTVITGNYAYWVGDEGVKAKYTDTDHLSSINNTTLNGASTYSAPATSNSTADVGLPAGQSYLYRMLAPARFAIEEMAQLGTYPANYPTLKNITSPLEAHYATNATSLADPIVGNVTDANDPLRLHFHDFTTYSYGVLSDTMRGGLKYDLTTAFENPALFQQDLQGKNILPDGSANTSIPTSTPTVFASPDYEAPVVSPQANLTWNTLYSYYNASANTTSVSSAIANISVGNGVNPVVVQGRLMFGFAYPSNNREVYISTSAVFVLANPYNFTISAPNGGLFLHYLITANHKYEWGICEVARSATGNGVSPLYLSTFNRTQGYSLSVLTNSGTPFDFEGYFPILMNSVSFPGTTNNVRSVLGNVSFQIANFTLQPGQVMAYSVGGGNGTLPSMFEDAGDPTSETPWLTHYIPVIGGVAGLVTGSSNGIANVTVPMVASSNISSTGFNADNFFLTDTGSAVPGGSSATTIDSAGELATLYPGASCSLQLSANLTAGNTTRTVFQTISGIDLTGDNIDSTAQTPPNPGNYKHMQAGQYASPRIVGSYYFFLALPALQSMPDSYQASSASPTGPLIDLVNGGNSGNAKQGTNYSLYSQFNLRAGNIAVPPWVALNTPAVNSSNSTTGLPTVPPYMRLYDRGVEFDVNGALSTTAAWNLGYEMFDNYIGGVGTSSSTIPTWGRANYTPGNSAKSGETNAILYSLPWRYPTGGASNSLPMISLGQFTGADVTADDVYSSVSYQPGAAFGNSYASPYVNLGQSIQQYPNAQYQVLTTTAQLNGPVLGPLQLGANYSLGPAAAKSTVNAYDISYLVNTALWDHYYFSGVAQGTASTMAVSSTTTPSTTTENEMVNGRMKFATGFAPNYTVLNIPYGKGQIANAVNDLGTGTTANPNKMPQGYALARYLLNDGAFNINSTSVEAWKALLASVRGLTPYYGGNIVANANNNAPLSANGLPNTAGVPVEAFPRYPLTLSMYANATSIIANYTFNGTATASDPPYYGDNAQAYMGFRALSDADVDHLAALIVQQVRLRGPFLSLGQFVNRRLDANANDPAALEGALQTAIDEMPNAANGNSAFNASPDLHNTTANGVTSSDGISLLPTGVYSGNYITTSTANSPYRSAGIPGWLTQADLLQALAPVLTVRSDTFLIRAYGQVNDPLDGSVQSRAWCEAVVQRLPDYIDTSDTTVNPNDPGEASFPDNPAVAPWAARPQNNVFGRRFHLVSLRWLNQSDI